MQATTDTVIGRGPDGKTITLNDVITLDTDFGLMIKGEDKVEMYTWENVIYRCWTDLKARETVWAEALADIVADAFDYEWDDEFEDDPAPTPTPTPVATPEPEAKASDNDDPDVNPYNN